MPSGIHNQTRRQLDVLRLWRRLSIGVLFVLAMLTFFTGLLAFLREVLLATATLRIGPQAQD